MERIASLLQSARHCPWVNAQSIVLGGAAVLIGLLLAIEFEIIDRWQAGDAIYLLARIFEVLALAALVGLGVAAVLACRENDRMGAHERRLRAEAACEARRNRVMLDHLTDLPNGRALVAVLKDAIERSPEEGLAVYLLDLDGFKSVNIAYGSSTGDAILRVVALRLRSLARRGDVIARFDGDAFSVLARDVASRQDAINIGQRYVASLDDAICIEDRAHMIGATIGLAFYPEDGVTPEELLHYAEVALRSDKARQRTELAYFVAVASTPAV